MISNNLLPNCPVTSSDVINAYKLFGPDVHLLKGKTVRRQPTRAASHTVPIPPDVMARYEQVVLCIDIMTVNKIPFLTTVSHDINFRTAT